MPPPQWSLVYADLDPVIGSEQRGLRPVLIVSNDDFNDVAPNVTVLPLTSTVRRLYPSEVLLPAGSAGQPGDSVVMAHQVGTVSKQRLRSALGMLMDERRRRAVIEAIKDHFDID